jgi:hypothetical protein
VEHPWLTRPENVAFTKFDFSISENFGFKGQMFLTEVGSATPITGDSNVTGYSVVRVDPRTKQTEQFLKNKQPGPSGAEYAETAGPRRPVDARFSRDGEVLYVVDIGVISGAPAGAGPFPQPVPGTGVIWRITREDKSTADLPGNISVVPPRFFSGR